MPMPDTPWSEVPLLCAGTLPDPAGSDQEDVCVVGGGIAGLTTAYLLARSGRSVVLFDAGTLGGGETSRTSAHLANALDDRFATLERLHGRRGARLAAESHAAAIDFIEELVTRRRIDCDFRRVDGFLMSATGDAAALESELVAAAGAGLTVEWTESVPGMEAWSGPAIRFARQGRLDPGAYIAGLIEACVDAGVRFRAHTRAVQVHDGKEVAIEAADGSVVRCAAAVVATNVPINDRVVLQTKLEAYRTYAIAVRMPMEMLPDALVWDDGTPYHYLRLAADAQGDLLILGGEDHKTGQGPADPQHSFAALEAWMRERFPRAGEIVHAWSGQIIEPVDALAYIGRNPGGSNVYVIAGDSGNGLTHATLGARLVSDLVRGLPNAWEELYRPSRVSLLSAREYAGHNANVLRQYGDWLTGGDVTTFDEVASGQGCIVRNGIHPIAAYRDGGGRLHTCSAICPHLGGLVRWNAVEKTWDCPCHGSRFTSRGEVINGPANTDLAPARMVSGSFPAQAVVA